MTLRRAPVTRPDHTRRPGRPSARTGPATTRAELLDAAQQLIAERGFDGTSIRELANRAGVTHGTVQHHFATKAALWQAVVDEVIVPRLTTVFGQLLAEPRAGVEAAVAALLRPALTGEGFSGAVLMDNSDGADERLRYLAEATEPGRAEVAARSQSLVAAGLLRPVSRTAFGALEIALFCLGSATEALRAFLDVDIADHEQQQALVADITDIYLYGVIPRD